MPDLLKLKDKENPSVSLLKDCLERLRRGELLAGPTDTLYGLFCDPFDHDALRRLVDLKGHREDKPIPLLVASPPQAQLLAASIPALAERLMAVFWPGPLTVVVPARPGLPQEVTGGTATVGLRQPASPYLLRLLESLGGPLTGTSANRAGEPPALSSSEVLAALGDEVDAVIDGGRATHSEGSTVVEVTESGLHILREGVLKADLLEPFTRDRRGS